MKMATLKNWKVKNQGKPVEFGGGIYKSSKPVPC